MFRADLVVRGSRVVTPEATRAAAIHIGRGKILGVLDVGDVPPGCPVVEAGSLVVMPGLVDTHVHVYGHGSTASDGFDAVTRSAAAGGVTTIVDMPMGSLATTTVSALQEKRDLAVGKCHVDVGFWGGLIHDNRSELLGLARAGVFGFACTLAHAGVDEFAPVSEADLREAMPLVARLGLPLLVDAELSGPVEDPDRRWLEWPPQIWRRRQYASYLASHPKSRENDAIALIIQLCRDFRTRTHIAPLSSSEALTPLYHARAARLPLTAETCPHYLSFVAEEIPDGATAFACAPPIRDRANRELLWGALKGRLIQLVVSDHAPAPSTRKHPWSGDFSDAGHGISSLPFGLAATWSVASKRGHSFGDLADWMCHGPVQLAALARKGAIAVGYDADLVIWNPEAHCPIPRSAVLSRQPDSPYAGRVLNGVVEQTFLRGHRIYEKGQGVTTAASGRLLAPTTPAG
jgi:allantoinase